MLMIAAYPPRSTPDADDGPALALLAAVCHQARKDATAGDAEARRWIGELAERRPRNLRTLGARAYAVAAD